MWLSTTISPWLIGQNKTCPSLSRAGRGQFLDLRGKALDDALTRLVAVGLLVLTLVGGAGRCDELLGHRGVEQVIRWDELGARRGVQRQTEARLVQIGRGQETLGRDGLVEEQVAENRQHALAVGRVREVLLEGGVGLRNDEVVAVRAASVGDNGDIVGGGVGGHLEQLGHAAEPHNVGLNDVEVAALDELAESVAGVLVFAGGELDAWVRALDLLESVGVIGGQALLPPVDVEVLAGLGNLDSVGDVEAHVAVDHEGEVGTNGLAVLAQEFDVLSQTLVAIIGAEGQGNLGSPEAHGLGRGGLGTSAVEVETLLGSAANQAVDGFISDLAEKIPQSQVDDGDDGDGETLATVEHGSAVHLLEE